MKRLLPRECADVRSGPVVVGLADPLQAVVVFNAWHVPGAAGTEDIRLADSRKHVLRADVVFRAGRSPPCCARTAASGASGPSTAPEAPGDHEPA